MCACVSFVVILAGVLGSSLCQIIPKTSANIVDRYTTLVPVNIRCTNDQGKGLTCKAIHPDQCKEQWNFPNPCTANNLSQNKTRFVHPYDETKFLMCSGLGKLYVIQCPQYEVYHAGCGQCVSRSASLTASCETPLPQMVNNPCSREAILSNELFFTFPGNISKFIHCDIWGKAWERICPPGEVWSQFDVACINPVHYNPCVRRTSGAFILYPHPCDPYKYLRCGVMDEPLEVRCEPRSAFSEITQKCEPIEIFNEPLENICGEFQFGFRSYRTGPTARLTISQPMDLRNSIDVMLSASEKGKMEVSVSQQGMAGASDSQQGMQSSGSLQRMMGESGSQQGPIQISSSRQGISGVSGFEQGMMEASGSQKKVMDASSSPLGVKDVPGSQQGMIDISGSQQGVNDISGSQQGMIDISGSQQGMIDTSGSQRGTIDILGSQQGMMDVSGFQQGFLDVSGSQQGMTDASSSQQGMIEVSGSQQGMMDVSGSQQGMMDVSGSQQGMMDVSGSQQGLMDVSGSQQGMMDVSGSQQGIMDVSGRQQGMIDVSGSQLGIMDASGKQQGMTDASGSKLGVMGIGNLENLTLGTGIVLDKQQTGITNILNGGQQSRLNEILSVWRKNVAKSGDGLPRLVDPVSGPGITDAVSGKPELMSVESVHPSQLKEYVYSDIKYSEPCTEENLSNRRTHFRLKGDPHSFLQCDNAGRMYKMPCSTNKKDWFDVYTMTCVDGPVHVDNRVPRG